MKGATLWPSGFIGYVTGILVLAIVVQCFCAALLIGHYERQIQQTDLGRRIAEQLVVAERILHRAGTDREAAVASLSTAHLRFELVDDAPERIGDTGPRVARLRSDIVRWEPELGSGDLSLSLPTATASGIDGRVAGSLALQSGQWITFETVNAFGSLNPVATTLAWVVFVTILVLVIAAAMVRTLGTPLRALSQSLDKVGTGVTVDFDEQAGPPDVRQVARTLNQMQERIDRLVRDRTQALAAVSHDLRTPLARLRLRVQSRDLDAERGPILRDMSEMDAMLSSLLAFLNETDDGEVPVRVNLASLVETVVDDAADLGRPAAYTGPSRLDVIARPVALKRVVANLVDNAVKYGERASVSLEPSGGQAILRVEDEGEGIDAGNLTRATEPFFRGDAARGRGTDGFGLGLSIAAQIVARHGGTITLTNRSEGGLRAEVVLPLA